MNGVSMCVHCGEPIVWAQNEVGNGPEGDRLWVLARGRQRGRPLHVCPKSPYNRHQPNR